MSVRKNQASLTVIERAAFISAVKTVKANGIYDIFVEQHRTAMLDRNINPVDPAHLGPAFLPWHREYLHRFELELQKIDPNVTLPYWDWTVDNSETSSMWDPDFLGGDGDGRHGEVTTGPFAYSAGNWTLTILDPGETDPFLKRAFGLMGRLPSQRLVDTVLAVVPYDSAPWTFGANGFRNSLEVPIHNNAHMWVGGSMMAATSPNDPVFWLHHCNIDKLWAQWQREHPDQNYIPDRSSVPNAPPGHALDDPMWPWQREPNPPTPRSVLDHKALGYTYDTDP